MNSQRRYDQLIATDRLTLTGAFHRAGWRTVFDVPPNTRDWPEGADFYGFDTLYDARNVGYRGPKFGYASMPDQYTLSHFREQELLPRTGSPVMAEIDLVSSHHPWAPLPRLVPWDGVGDGSVFDGMPEQGDSCAEVFSDPDRVRQAYGAVHRVHARHRGLLPDHVPGRRPRRGDARRPPAAPLRQWRRPGPRRTRHRHRPRPGRHGADLGLGLVAGFAPAVGRPRSGAWTAFVTGS